jgi:hypothetical protein
MAVTGPDSPNPSPTMNRPKIIVPTCVEIALMMAPIIIGTQLIWKARLRPKLSAMVPLIAQPKKALARVTLTTNPAKFQDEYHHHVNSSGYPTVFLKKPKNPSLKPSTTP